MPAALVSAGLTFFSTLAGGTAALRWPRQVQPLMALAGGVILAAVFLDLLPDAVDRAIALGMPVAVPLGCVLLGYLTFQLLDHIIHEHSHPGGTTPDAAGVVGAIGFIIH